MANDRPKSKVPKRESTRPFTFFFLVLPYGISSGFISITLPFVLTRAGFSVALALFVLQLINTMQSRRQIPATVLP